MKYSYTLLFILGTVFPYGAFLPWLVNNGFDLALIFKLALINEISLFAWFDVIFSAICLLVFILVEGRRMKIKLLWLPVVATFTIGVSAGLPLFLLLREFHLEKS